MIPKQIIIHHTDSSRDRTTFQDVESWHKLRWPDFISQLGWYIGYHYLINGKGEILKARNDNEIGAHCIPNYEKLGICLTGNFEIEKPSEAQLNSLEPLLNKLKSIYQITDENIFGHCEKSQTLCPGKNLMDWLKLYRKVNWLKQQIQKLLALLKGRR